MESTKAERAMLRARVEMVEAAQELERAGRAMERQDCARRLDDAADDRHGKHPEAVRALREAAAMLRDT